MASADIIVWEAGGDGAAALRQLGEGKFRVERTLDYREFCATAATNPFAIGLWEVNLSNWEARAEQLVEFAQRHPRTVVAIAAIGLPNAVIELLRELGAALVARHRLEERLVLKLAARRQESNSSDFASWRETIQTPITWLPSEPTN
jgi:hypothetical protein